MRPLTPNQRRFIAALVAHGDPARAAASAGYEGEPRVVAYKQMRSPSVRAALLVEREHLAAHVVAFLDGLPPPKPARAPPVEKPKRQPKAKKAPAGADVPPLPPRPVGRPPVVRGDAAAPAGVDLSNVDSLAMRIAIERARIAFADIRSVVTWGDGGVAIVPSEAVAPEVSAAVAEVKQTNHGIAVKMHDKLAALDALCRQFGIGADYGQKDGDKNATLVLQIIGLEAAAAATPMPANELDGGPLIDLVAVG